MQPNTTLDKFLGPEQYVLFLILLDYIGQTDVLENELENARNLNLDFHRFRYALYDTGTWTIANYSIDRVIATATTFDQDTINEIKLESENNRRANLVRNTLVMKQLSEIAQAFHDAGIEFILLKGSACLVTELWHSLEDRFLSDIDILILEEQSIAASEVLFSLGYVCGELGIELDEDHHHLPPFTHYSKNKLTIELHIRAGTPRTGLDLPVSEIHACCRSHAYEGQNYVTLALKHSIALARLHGGEQLQVRKKIYLPLKDMLDLYFLRLQAGKSTETDLHCDDLLMRLFNTLYDNLFEMNKQTTSNYSRYQVAIYNFLLKHSRPPRYPTSLSTMHLTRNNRKFAIGLMNNSPTQNLQRIKKLFG